MKGVEEIIYICFLCWIRLQVFCRNDYENEKEENTDTAFTGVSIDEKKHFLSQNLRAANSDVVRWADSVSVFFLRRAVLQLPPFSGGELTTFAE